MQPYCSMSGVGRQNCTPTKEAPGRTLMLKGLFFHSQIFLAGICAYSAIYHCTVDTGRSQRRVHLLFAGISILMALYTLSNVQSFAQTTLADFIPNLRLTFVFYILFIGLFPWFVAEYSRARPMPVLAGLSTLVSVQFVVNLIEPYTILYSEIHGFKHVIRPSGAEFFTPLGTAGTWFYAWVATVCIVYIFGICTLVACFRRDRRNTTLVMICAVGMLLAFSIAGTLFRMGIIHIPPLVPFGFLGMVIVMGLTLNYEMQQDRKRAEQAINKSEHELRMLAESMPQIVWITRPDGWNIYFNQQWVEYTGLTLEESSGHGWNKPFHPDDQQRAWDAWQNATQNLAEYVLECRLRRADGVYKWWLIRGVPFLDEHGAVLKWFGTCTDIDEFKRADEERKLMVNQLQDKTVELERFIYTVSHDLKSPLITISAFLGYLKEDFKKNNEAAFTSSLSRISQAALRMKQLLDELLEMSRIGRKIKPAERVDLSALVNEAVETISGRIHECGAVVEIDPDLPAVMVDRHRILQVYENLLDNAVKFSSGQEEPPRIMVGVHRNEKGEQILFIKDNGIGIEPRYTNKVFELFEKLDPRSSGTGVGLAIVKRIIEIHGGRIWAESDGIGRSTTFCFTLPLAES